MVFATKAMRMPMLHQFPRHLMMQLPFPEIPSKPCKIQRLRYTQSTAR